ncbi:MAG: lycopene cyclase [Flavobacteriaceae bacterium]|nr:lycopene cyclase [Flavobacteriaceae bacterium]
MNQKIYDYIICGAGASGLILVSSMINDKYFSNKKILLIEKENKNLNDRTWSFWEEKNGKFDKLLSKSWSFAKFKSANTNLKFNLDPFIYKTIRSSDFYKKLFGKIKLNKQIKIQNLEVKKIISKKNKVVVRTNSEEFVGKYVFSSILDKTKLKNSSFPYLIQHFEGWFIKTKKPLFNDNEATLMDFSIKQKNDTRFIYILPFKSNEALVEFTLFSKSILKKPEYEKVLKQYMTSKGINNYEILEKEKGIIPMTCYPFEKHNDSRLLFIGTAGGWTKASSGYTFKNIINKTELLINFLKKENDLKKFNNKSRFNFYDLILIDVLYNFNHLGNKIFSSLFMNNKPNKVFKFLDETTTFLDELKIMYSFPWSIKILFIKALFKNLFKF